MAFTCLPIFLAAETIKELKEDIQKQLSESQENMDKKI
jgi:hypothetical protein